MTTGMGSRSGYCRVFRGSWFWRSALLWWVSGGRRGDVGLISLLQVTPLRNYPVQEVNDQSKRLLQLHLNRCLGLCRIIQQRHTLEAVPVAEVAFQLGQKRGRFWVYGQERVCYIPQYPSKCSIL